MSAPRSTWHGSILGRHVDLSERCELRERSERQDLLGRHSADLLQQPQKIGLAPFFDDLPVRETIEFHRLTSIFFPVDGPPKKAPRCVPALCSAQLPCRV